MKNVANTEAYSAFDHIFLKALRSASHVVGVSRLTQPFWGRWRASEIGDDALFGFLKSIRSLDDWPDAALHTVRREEEGFARRQSALNVEQTVEALRRLAYLANLGQWGILPLGDTKRFLYRKARDYTAEAEKLAFGARFERLAIKWREKTFYGNLHLPPPRVEPAPLVVVVHGLDDAKEEHLATDLALLSAGFAVLNGDGPGQGEAFLLDGILWTPDYPALVSAAIDALADRPEIDAARVGTAGFSIGSLWSISAASRDRRIKAIYDLGAPINTRAFGRVPFLIKSKMCQITGARTDGEIAAVLAQNFIDRPEILENIFAAVRIAHGLKDRVVPTKDKSWLRDELLRLKRSPDVSMITFPDGDHCCTNHIPEIRRDMAAFFQKHLLKNSGRTDA